MKITVLGAGAMGMLFSAYLSKQNDVWVVDVDKSRVDKINEDGVTVREKDGSSAQYYPKAVTATQGLPVMDLIIVFVKSMFTVDALEANRGLIGKDTYLMTLQNGAGHEGKLLKFVDRDHVVIGSTQHNSSVAENGCAFHGGSGMTSIGILAGNSERIQFIADSMTACGFEAKTSNEVKKQIWTKLFTNTAASSLTAVLQVPLGFLVEDPGAHSVMLALCREAVAVANSENGDCFDEDEVISGVETVCRNAPNGLTSIYADIRDGRRTEVDTISGSVVEAAHDAGIPVPVHETVVALIHALEAKNREKNA